MRLALTVGRLVALCSAAALLLAACSPVASSPGAPAEAPAAAPTAAPAPVPQPTVETPTLAPTPSPDPTPAPAAALVEPATETASPQAEVAHATEPPPAAEPAAAELPVEAATPAILFTRFRSAADFSAGLFEGTQVAGETVSLAPGATSGAWLSPPIDPGFPFARLVPSWTADTPGGSWIEVEVQATTADDRRTRWYGLGVWAEGDHAVQRSSINGQRDADARVATDTLEAADQTLLGYQLRISLQRASADQESPALRMVGAMVAESRSPLLDGPSPTGLGEAVELPVPPYSQLVHAGSYTQFAGGGSVWCSPTSTQMVVEYWGAAPSAEELAWVRPGYPDPSVVFAARGTYDAAYRGTGNWSFNTAYAGRYGLDAFVTQLRSLAEAERFIQAGIPLIASIRVAPGDLDGFLPSSGPVGHLVVVIGFDEAGNPIVNDPLARSNSTVRRVYDRAQFERVWLRGSGGIVYVIHPPDLPLADAAGAAPNR